METLSRRKVLSGGVAVGAATAIGMSAMATEHNGDHVLFAAIKEYNDLEIESIELNERKTKIIANLGPDGIVVRRDVYGPREIRYNNSALINGYCKGMKDNGVEGSDEIKEAMLSDLRKVQEKRENLKRKSGFYGLKERESYVLNRMGELMLLIAQHPARTPKGLAAKIEFILKADPNSADALLGKVAKRLVFQGVTYI